ncbi:hypothetical protein BE20_34520 [Sorangium cellulosum]|nr:hypothetical protein BE20_34520 [Sorangium cellulosum]
MFVSMPMSPTTTTSGARSWWTAGELTRHRGAASGCPPRRRPGRQPDAAPRAPKPGPPAYRDLAAVHKSSLARAQAIGPCAKVDLH